MTDDEVLAIVDRRLSQVEPMIPPLALTGVQQSVAAPVDRGRLRPIAGPPVAILMLVILAVVAIAVFQRPVADPGTAPGDSAEASAAPSATTPSPRPSPSPSITASLEVIRGDGYAELLILRRMGWVNVCMVRVFRDGPAVDPDSIDEAATATGTEEGWVVVDESGRFWIGTDVERAAVGIGASMLVIGEQGDPLVVVDGVASRFLAKQTPAGRTYWSTPDEVRPCPTAP